MERDIQTGGTSQPFGPKSVSKKALRQPKDAAEPHPGVTKRTRIRSIGVDSFKPSLHSGLSMVFSSAGIRGKSISIIYRQLLERKTVLKIQDKSFVAIEYTLSLESGDEVDQSEPGKPLGFVFNTGQMISGLEKQIEGKEAGFETKFVVEPEDGYGVAQPDLLRKTERKNFPDDIELKPGMVFQAENPQGNVPFTIKSIEDDTVVIDFNHPLCGEKLHFDLKVVEVRQATEEEIHAATSQCEQSGSCGGGCCSC